MSKNREKMKKMDKKIEKIVILIGVLNLSILPKTARELLAGFSEEEKNALIKFYESVLKLKSADLDLARVIDPQGFEKLMSEKFQAEEIAENQFLEELENLTKEKNEKIFSLGEEFKKIQEKSIYDFEEDISLIEKLN
jgi:hypothetical protein